MTGGEGHIIVFVVLALCFAFYAYHIVLFTTGWFRLSDPLPVEKEPNLPRVSVVVPLRNEEDHVNGLVRHFLAQNYPPGLLELVLVDDHSTDGTVERVRMMIDKSKGSAIRLLDLEEEGIPGSKKNALTAGVKQSKGQLIITTDADCTPEIEWIRIFASFFVHEPKKMMSGPVVLKRYTESPVSWFEEFEFSSLVASGAGAIGIQKPIFCNGANMAYEKDAFLAVCGYEGNERFSSGDDVFLLHKIKKVYGPGSIGFIKDPGAIVSSKPEKDIKGFIRQRVRWGAKSRGYKDFMAVSTALAVVIFNLALLAVLLYSGVRLFMSKEADMPLLSLLVFFILKCLTDLPLMWSMASFTRRRKLLWCYLFFQLVYPFYIMIITLGILFLRPEWKGRKTS